MFEFLTESYIFPETPGPAGSLCKLCAILKWSDRRPAWCCGSSTWSSFVSSKASQLAKPATFFTRYISIKSVSIKSKNCVDISLRLSCTFPSDYNESSGGQHEKMTQKNVWEKQDCSSRVWTSFQAALLGTNGREILSFESGVVCSRDVWFHDLDEEVT